jgi:hypothetical protein
MTDATSELKISKKLVLVFDICSSTSILEDLILSGNIQNYRDLLIELNDFLQKSSHSMHFEIYKFLGDGWILIFPENSKDSSPMPFVKELCDKYQILSDKYLAEILNIPPKTMGLTFGMDMGELTRLQMNKVVEYIGRPLNIACRLQGSISLKDKEPQNKALMSCQTYSYLKKTLGIDLRPYNPVSVSRTLKNVGGSAEVSCWKLKML